MSAEPRPHTTRLHSALSEARPIMGRDGRIVWTSAILLVSGICIIPFDGWLFYAPSVALWLLSVRLWQIGGNLWNRNPFALDEYWAHLRTPLRGRAAERPRR
jgi:type IV secretory pathway TrbD component